MTNQNISLKCLTCQQKNPVKKSQALDLKETLLCSSCQSDLLPFFSKPLNNISPQAFIHQLDQQMLHALKAIPGVDTLLRSLLKHSFELNMRLHHQGNFLQISHKQAKNIYYQLEHACSVLDIADVPELYLVPNASINAYTFGVEKCAIALTSACVEQLSDDEILSVLAHELGHIKAHHVLYKIASRILSSLADSLAQKTLGLSGLMLYPIKIALLRWDRASELSSDRASLLVVKNPAIVLTSLMKMAGGLNTRKLNIKAFIEQAESYEKTKEEGPLGKYMALMDSMFLSHPFPIWRAQEIIAWVEAGAYFNILQGDYARGNYEASRSTKTLEQTLGSLKSWYDRNFNE